MKNKTIKSKSLLTESEKFRFQELAGIKPRSSKLIREAFPDDQDEVEEEPVTDPSEADPNSSPEMEGGDGMDLDNGGDPMGDLGGETDLDTDSDLDVDSMGGGADVGVAEDPMVDKIVELVSRGIRTALLDAKSSGELDISSSEPDEIEGADLEPSTEEDLDSDLGPEVDETEDNLGTPDEEPLNEAVPLPSPRNEKHDFYKKLEEDLFESMRKAAKRAIKESSTKSLHAKPVAGKTPAKPVNKKKV